MGVAAGLIGAIGAFGLVKLHARVHPHITEVADELGDQPDQREQIQRAQHHGVVAADHALVAEQAQAVEREQGFDEQRTCKERADEGCRKARDDGDQRIDAITKINTKSNPAIKSA